MARPLKDSIDYFSHDTDMSEDDKIQLLEYKYGLIGYAIYNKILERVYKTNMEFNLLSDDDFCLYSGKWRIEKEKLIEIVSFMREKKLFPSENFASSGVKKRIKKIKSERVRRRNYYKNKAHTETVLDVQNTVKTLERTNLYAQTKVNKSKVKESKLNKSINEREDTPDIFKLWIDTWGKTPGIPEQEETTLLITKYGYDHVKKIFREGKLKGFKIFQTFLDSLDDQGNIKPKETNGTGYRESGKKFKVIGSD